jgi:excisionase family DNA binding protein
VSEANRAATPKAPWTAETKTKQFNSGEAETRTTDYPDGRRTIMSERLMTLAELAELVGVPVTTLYQWRHRGEGPPGYRVGRHVRYRRAAVEAWLETQADQYRRASGF